MSELPAVRFLRTLCGAVLREEAPAAAAARAHAALLDLWASQRSLVLEVQFTGFVAKGERLGGVEPSLLRAAGQLIVHRVSRLGFTPEVAPADLAALFEAVSRLPAELGADGVVGAVRAAAPQGIYVSTSTGEVYKPAAKPAAAEEAPHPSVVDDAPAPPPSAWGSGVGVEVAEEENAELSTFEFVEDVLDLSRAAPVSPAPPAEPPRSEEPAANDMYHFFRASSSDRSDAESARLPALLHATDNMSRFDDLAASCARNALRDLRAGDPMQAVELLDALAMEAERTDRTRLFRESAAQALRSAASADNLPHLVELLQLGGDARERVLHVLFFLGGEAVTLLENHLFRTPDAELRRAIFRRLLRGEGGARPAVARALADSPVRARAILELVTIAEVEPEQAIRWTADAAAHPDVAVRTDAARVAAQLGGRGGIRVLVDLLADADRGVRRAALHGLAAMQDASAVPFLSRFLNENGDDDLQLAAVAALGRTGSADALPPLLAIVNKRQLFGGRKAKALKFAAIEAIGLTGAPAARDVLSSISSGSDADLAAEARRALAAFA